MSLLAFSSSLRAERGNPVGLCNLMPFLSSVSDSLRLLEYVLPDACFYRRLLKLLGFRKTLNVGMLEGS